MIDDDNTYYEFDVVHYRRPTPSPQLPLQLLELSTQIINTSHHLIMAPPVINLEPYKDEIAKLVRDRKTLQQIQLTLKVRHHIQISDRSLKSRLRLWGFNKNILLDNDQKEARDNRIIELYRQGLRDLEILRVLEKEGYQTTAASLKRIRKKLDLQTYIRGEERELADEEIIPLVKEEFDKGVIHGFGREFLYTYFRSQGIFIARLDHNL